MSQSHVPSAPFARYSIRRRSGRVLAALIAVTAFVGLQATAVRDSSGNGKLPGLPVPVPNVVGHIASAALVAPLSTSDCQAQIGIHCYSPLQYRVAYNLNPLYQSGISGAGRTIMIVDSFGSPTIQHDLEAFDAQWGLPNTTVQIVQAGTIPPFDPTNPDHVGWAQETTLDVEMRARDRAGRTHRAGRDSRCRDRRYDHFPEMMNAEKALIDHGVGDVITQSFGATENTFPGFDQGNYSSLLNLRYAFTMCAKHGVTVLGSSGDDGATDATLDGSSTYPYPVNSWPSSDPLVTSVGGTQLNLDNAGNRLSPMSCGTTASVPVAAASPRCSAVRSSRSVSPVWSETTAAPRHCSMSAAVDGGAWVYYSFVNPTSPWHIFGGTSEASPIFSGIVAMADQVAHRRLGNINAGLYLLSALSQRTQLPTGIVDVTSGDNSFAGVTGYPARTGYDLASGVGTIDGNKFVRALARFG